MWVAKVLKKVWLPSLILTVGSGVLVMSCS